MSLRLTQKELDAIAAKHGRWAKPGPAIAGAPVPTNREMLEELMAKAGSRPAGLRHKFHAVRTERDGLSFPSKMEAAYYDLLKLEQAAGTVVMFQMQVPFHCPGGIVYRLDYQVFMADGRVRLVEVKGKRTEAFNLKKRLVEHHYPVKLELVRLRGTHWEDITDVAA